MNKNPWLIAGIAASGVVMAASFVAAFPETVKRKTTAGSSSRSNYRSSTECLPSRAWNGITDTFGYFAANTIAVASSVADSVCDTARETYSSVSDNVSSYSPSSHSTSSSSSSDSYSGGSDSGSF